MPSTKSRIWVVGTGSSLNRTPLELLKNEVSIGMNRIDLIYPRTTWRPAYYFCTDVAEGDENWRKAANHEYKDRFLWDGLDFDGPHTDISRCAEHHFYASDNYDKRAQSWHLPKLCTAFASIYTMMQLSVIMGFDEIYLLGCDLWGEGENHFSGEYVKWEDTERRNRDALWLHQVSEMSSPVPIYNATVGGQLEIYPRVDIRKVLQ